MSQEPQHERRSFSDEFRRDDVNGIVDQGYSFRTAADAARVSPESSLHLPSKARSPTIQPLAPTVRSQLPTDQQTQTLVGPVSRTDASRSYRSFDPQLDEGKPRLGRPFVPSGSG